MAEDVFQRLEDLHEELNIPEDTVMELWELFAQINWIFTRKIGDPVAFSKLTDREIDAEFKVYANNFNGSSFSGRERLYKRFINFCFWIKKSL